MTTRRPYKLGSEVGLERALESTADVQTAHKKIEQSRRTAAGVMKRDVIAVKRTWKLSWESLEGKSSDTWDGGLGRDELYQLFSDGGELSLLVPTADPAPGGEYYEQVDVLFDGDFDENVIRRNPRFVYKLKLGFVEV